MAGRTKRTFNELTDAEARRIAMTETAAVYGQGRQSATLIYWSNPTIKDRVARMRSRGLVIFPAPEASPAGPKELEWVTLLKKHLAGQWKKRIRNQLTGRFRDEWCDNGEDHGADCLNMSAVFAVLAKILVDSTEEMMTEEAPRSEVVAA